MTRLSIILSLAALSVIAIAAPREFRVYPSYETQDLRALPADWRERTEWVQARLMYPTHSDPFVTFEPFLRDPDWRSGATSWTQDYPRADRNFILAVRRLTSLHARSVEQPVNPDDGDDLFNWPWLVAGEMGDWDLTSTQAAKLREYLLRGGFLYCDDFWGTKEWDRFMESMRRVFPDHSVIDIPDADSVWRTIYALDGPRPLVPGKWALDDGNLSRNGGNKPYWRGIYDDHGRLMVAITFNSDVGDSWEFADDPEYPEHYADFGVRLGVNLVVYDLTH